MAKAGDNNPRAFGDAVSLDAWRTSFNEETGEADLHVNVVFSEGRIGGLDGPVRFRLEIIRAEVHVLRDSANVLKIKSSSVASQQPPRADRTVSEVQESEGGGSASLSLGSSVSGQASASKKHTSRREVVINDTGEALSFLSMRTSQGYAFRIASEDKDTLIGSPWVAAEKLLTFTDTAHPRYIGEPPELRIELRCRREDLHITSIEFTDSGRHFYELSANKRMAIEQYIKTELLRIGLLVGDISDPFSEIVLADVTPEEE